MLFAPCAADCEGPGLAVAFLASLAAGAATVFGAGATTYVSGRAGGLTRMSGVSAQSSSLFAIAPRTAATTRHDQPVVRGQPVCQRCRAHVGSTAAVAATVGFVAHTAAVEAALAPQTSDLDVEILPRTHREFALDFRRHAPDTAASAQRADSDDLHPRHCGRHEVYLLATGVGKARRSSRALATLAQGRRRTSCTALSRSVLACRHRTTRTPRPNHASCVLLSPHTTPSQPLVAPIRRRGL